MHRIKYILLFAVVFLIFKAFFLDDYLEKRSAENNETAKVEEINSSTEPEPAVQSAPKSHTPLKKNEGMPIDQLGDSIAEKLDKKL